MFKQILNNLTNSLNMKKNISSLFNYDSNPSTKTSSSFDDFTDIINEEKTIHDFREKMKYNEKELFNDFIKNITSIIFESRKEKANNDFSLNTSKNSDNFNNVFTSNDNSFNPEIDDLFLYNDFYQDKEEFHKLVIEFYLTKKIGNKLIKELVEKWKLSYKLDNDNKATYLQVIKTKMNIYLRSITSYSRLLPLYQFILTNKNNNNYIIDFKFYQNNSNKKGKFLMKPSGNVLLKNQNLFSFKTNIKYYNLNELKNIFENNDDIDIHTPSKSKSNSFNGTNINLIGFDNSDKSSDDNIINSNNDEIKTINTEINNKQINEINDESDNSSFCLIYDSQEEKNKIKKEKHEKNGINKRKNSSISNGYETTEDCSPRNSNWNNNNNNPINELENYNERNVLSVSTRKTFKKTENNNINNILKAYSSVKDMIENLNSSIIIKTNKFIDFAKACG